MTKRTGRTGFIPPLEKRLERTASALHRLNNRDGMAHALAVGRTVIAELYDGDLTRWRARSRKNTSLRRLAGRPDVHLSATELWRCLDAAETTANAGVSKWKHVTRAHLRASRCVAQADRVRLLLACDAEGWTVDRLRQECGRFAVPPRRGRARGGRPRSPEVLQALRTSRRELTRARSARIDGDTVHESKALIDAIRGELDALDATVSSLQCAD